MRLGVEKVVVVGLCGFLCSLSLAGPRPENAAESRTVEAVDWSLLDFPEGRHIERVKLVMEDFSELGGGGSGTFVPEGEVIEITDEPTLKKIENGLGGSVRRAVPGLTGGWGTLCFGRLVVATSEGEKFVIGVSGVAFHLEETTPNIPSAFWSGSLSKIVEDTYSSRTEKEIQFQGSSLTGSHRKVLLDSAGFEGKAREGQ